MRLLPILEALFVVGLGVLAIWAVSALGRWLDRREARRNTLYRASWTAGDPRLAEVRDLLVDIGERLGVNVVGAANRTEDVFRQGEVGSIEVTLTLYRRR